jgi:hypothetical protein
MRAGRKSREGIPHPDPLPEGEGELIPKDLAPPGKGEVPSQYLLALWERGRGEGVATKYGKKRIDENCLQVGV